MTQRDDMVFAPDPGVKREANARVRAVEERRLFSAKKKGGLVRRVRQLRRLRKLATRRAGRPGKASATARRLAQAGRGAAVRGGARGAARALATPIGAVVAGIAVIGLVALRLASGQPIEGMGEQVNKILLGDADDEARARTATKQQLKSSTNITSILGREYATAIKAGKASAGVNTQVKKIADEFTRMNTRDELGASIIREAFPVNNTLDMLIIRARDVIVATWNGNGGESSVDKLAQKLGSHAAGGGDKNTSGAKATGR